MTNWKQGEKCEFQTGFGEIIVPDEDVNGVIIVRAESGEYRRVNKQSVSHIKTPTEIDREEKYRKLIELMPKGYSSTFNNGMSKAINVLIDAGLLSDNKSILNAQLEILKKVRVHNQRMIAIHGFSWRTKHIIENIEDEERDLRMMIDND